MTSNREKMPAVDYKVASLVGILADLDGFGGALLAPWGWQSRKFNDPRYPRPYSMSHDGPPYSPRMWLGRRPTTTESQAFHRVTLDLARQGLVELIARYNGRTTHVRPTPRGLDVAIKVVRQGGEEPGLDNIMAALDASKWASPKHRQAVAALRQEATEV
jgi:hypothetical protein